MTERQYGHLVFCVDSDERFALGDPVWGMTVNPQASAVALRSKGNHSTFAAHPPSTGAKPNQFAAMSFTSFSVIGNALRLRRLSL